MKKQFLIIFLSALIFSSISAQVQIGLMGGLNFSDSDQEQFYFSEARHTTKLMLGAVADFQLSKNFSLRCEPVYIEKGTYRDEVFISGLSSRIAFNLSYFEIPLLVKYSVDGNFSPFIIVGPSVGFNLTSDLSTELAGFDISIGAGDIMKPVEFSFNLGGGINYKLDNLLSIFIEAKYVFGLNDIINKNEFRFEFAGSHEHFSVPNGTQYNNKGLQILCGFTFPLIFE